MTLTPKILMAALVAAAVTANAQQSKYFSDTENYRWQFAEELYQSKVYHASQFEYIRQYFYQNNLERSQKEAALFFSNVIGVILQQNHAKEGLAAFLREYPNSAFFAQANLPLADYYLAQKDFGTALTTLQKVNQNGLSREENTQYILKLGYAKFMTGDSRGALEALEEAYGSSSGEEKGDIAYMLGHLYYADGRNDRAFDYFDQIKDNAKYAKLVKPYYVQLHFNEKNYTEAISEGNSLLRENISEAYRAEVHKIIGESHFMLGDYEAAHPHLKTFLESKDNPSESDLYEMGFVAAHLKRYDEAVSFYNRLLNSQSPLAQNAYYQLGNSYLEVGRKQEALAAFRSASVMTYDRNVQKLAHRQYAKLSYDIGNPFESPQTAIKTYLEMYGFEKEIETLLVKSYLYSGDYKGTIEAIEDLNSSDPSIQKIYQEVSFLYGTEHFNKGNYAESAKYCEQSLKYSYNREFNLRAQYWLAQTRYQLGDYPAAITAYEKLRTAGDFKEKNQLSYDLGYAYFKSKNFEAAKKYFSEYLQNPAPEFKNDAELRLADTYYANNELNEAIAIYSAAENASDYTMYQKAMALGFKGDTEAKIAELKKMLARYPDSEYRDDAEYGIGTSYAAMEQYAEANQYFEKVIRGSADKDLVASAEIYRAQNYADMGQEDRALAELRTLGEKYRNTAYAEKIVAAARPIFIKNGDVTGYENFARNMNIRISGSEVSELNLTTARQFYAKKDFRAAVPYYEKYLTQNPKGENLYQAQYELGESYYQVSDLTKSLLVLEEVAVVQNDYQEDAQVRLAQIYLAQKNTASAKKYLAVLAQSQSANIRNFANVELMGIYSAEKNDAKAEELANEVLKNPKNSVAVLEQARVIKARSLMNAGRDKDAQAAYAALEKSSNTAVAAEALYAKAFYQHKAKAFKTSNETIFKLADNYASEEYWGAKALVLLARNYVALKDRYQASYTVDQIIENYGDFPEIVAEAREVKKLIK